jgi:hypothetical protein
LVWSVNKSRPDLFRKLQDLNEVANAETKAHRDFERNVGANSAKMSRRIQTVDVWSP